MFFIICKCYYIECCDFFCKSVRFLSITVIFLSVEIYRFIFPLPWYHLFLALPSADPLQSTKYAIQTVFSISKRAVLWTSDYVW